MKKNILMSICFVFISLNATKANNDSLLVNNNDSLLTDNCIEIIKSNDSITEQNSIETESINTNKLNKRRQLNFKVSKIENIATKPEGFGDFLNNLWDIISSPFKPVWGYYEEDDYNKEGPYFLFMHSSGGATYISKQMERIRQKIRIENSSERKIYQAIFDEAGTTTIDNCNSGNGLCISATRAKASAFVYLVGLDKNGKLLDTPDTHGPIRRGYRDRALAYIRDVDIPGLHNFWDALSFTGVGILTDPIAAFAVWEKLVLRSKELQMLCQTWDMLRWCYNIDPNLPNDGLIRSRLDESAQQIIDHYVTPLHRRAQTGIYRFAHNNYNLIVGSALASAAVCFHDYGTYFFLTEKKPDRWANSAYYNIHKVMWSDGLIYGKKMSMPGNTYGYAEGTYYFQYGFENMLPMFLARYNFASSDKTVGYNSFTLDPFPKYVRNFWYDNDYHNIYKWYNNLIQSDKKAPTIDDSWAGKQFNTSMAILRKHNGEQYNFIDDIEALRLNDFSLREDYLASLTPPVKKDLPQSIQMASGDAVIRSRESDANKHYLYINAEKESAKDGGWHEHEDFGSFIITADNDILMMDPPLYKDGEDEINKIEHHNTLSIGGNVFPSIKSSSEPIDLGGIATMEIKTIGLMGEWNRTFLVNRDGVKDINGNLVIGYHYVIFDKVFPLASSNFSFNFSGNGDENTHNHFIDGEIDWINPCASSYNQYNWGIRAQITPSITTGQYQLINTAKSGVGEGLPASGNHTRYTYKVNTSDVFSVTSFLQPRKCLADGTLGKTMSKSTNKYGSILIYDDTVYKPKLIYIGKNTLELDTLKDPLNIDSLSVLSTNAKLTSFCYGLDSNQQAGYCIAYSRFRSATIFNGDTLIYKNQFYIKANKRADIQYKLVGKYKYQGYIQCDSLDSVSFYLPDADSNYAMGAVNKNGNLDYKYNDTTHIITLIVPKGFTEFVIQLADPCLMNCYFPTALDSIKNTFDYNTGLPEALPYKLTITPPNGLLKIRNNSQMTICAYKWLHNKDSLILDGPCPQQTKEFGLSICPDLKSRLINTNFNNKTEITLSPFASLILDSGSYTRFGNYTRLIVLPNANFIIRKNAILDIGDEKGCGHAEIICHPGSYVHFEDSADIKFWKIPGDTNDIHLFYIAVNPPNLHIPAHAGIEPSVFNMLVYADSIALGSAGPICGVAQIKPDWGINNRDWGFANFAYPKAWAYISKDTFCKNECPEINFDRMLNDVKRSITFCRIDTNYSVIPYQPIFDTCVVPQKPHINTNSNGDLCDTLLPLKNIAFCDLPIKTPNHWYRITLTSTNDCNQTDTKTLYYFVLPDVYTNFSLPQTACPNNIVAIDLSDSSSYKLREKTRWHLHLIDTNETKISTKRINYGGDWEYLKQSYPDTFTFPNFNWIGGYSYAVSYTVTSRNCGDTIIWDTINVYPGANIILERPTVYAQPLAGAISVKLHGYTSSIDSFKWEPTTWLDSANSLTPISTPLDSITYVLTTYKDNCMATDTAYIKYNKYANAGHNDTLCIDSIYKDVLIGYPYDLTLFLGILYYYNNQQFMDYYNANNNNNNTANYFRYFTHFMHTSVFQNSFINCGSNMYQIFTDLVNKKVFFNQNWYKGYYNHFIQFDNASLPILTVFNDEVNANSELKNHLDSLTDWGQIGPCMVDMFANYNNFVLNEHDRISARWTKIENADTTLLNNWDELFIAVDAPTQSSKYLLNVITPEKAEIDEITILVDTTLKPLFATALQFDSTVFFMNYSEPISNATTYEWNFGDGSAISNELNPIHTFPVFDSNYVVCLTASNKCNSWQYCDTVWIDSLHLGGAFKTTNKPAFFETNQQATEKINVRSVLGIKPEARNQQLVALQNYPNPFNQSTIIDYQIWQSFNHAELRITNILGQVLFSQKLQKPIDKVEIDGSNLANGLYYYSIVVDNSVKLTKTMSVIH